jgi:hypothetical protein
MGARCLLPNFISLVTSGSIAISCRMTMAHARQVAAVHVSRQDHLGWPQRCEPSSLPSLLSSWLVRQFSLVVESLVLPPFDPGHDVSRGCPITFERVGDDGTWDIAQPLQKRAEDARGGRSIAPGLHQNVERIPILIHRPPEKVVLAVHGRHDFVQVPCAPASRLSVPEGSGIGLPDFERPLPDSFVADDPPREARISSTSRKLNVNR